MFTDSLRSDTRSFVATALLDQTADRSPMTTASAAYTLREWIREGVDLPDGITAPLLAAEWNAQVDARSTECYNTKKKEDNTMKKSEIIEKYAQDITDTMIDRYETVLKSDGRVQYKVYIWSDGEVECLEGVSGDNSWLQPYDSEPRDLFYVCKIDMPFFDPWDCAGMQPPEDDAEREEALQSIIDWMMDEYKSSVSEKLESIIEDAKFDEKYGEDSFPPYRG